MTFQARDRSVARGFVARPLDFAEEFSCRSSGFVNPSTYSHTDVRDHIIADHRKRSLIVNYVSDSERNHPSSKRLKTARKLSTADLAYSPSKSAGSNVAEYHPKSKPEQKARTKRVRSWFRKESTTIEEPKQEQPEPFIVTEQIENMVEDLAKKCMEQARSRKMRVFDPDRIVCRALHYMTNLTHQHLYLDIAYGGGGSPSNFRETSQWAQYNVNIAEREVRPIAEKEDPIYEDNIRHLRDELRVLEPKAEPRSSWRHNLFRTKKPANDRTEDKSRDKRRVVDEPLEPPPSPVLQAKKMKGRHARGRGVDRSQPSRPWTPMTIAGFDNQPAQGPRLPSCRHLCAQADGQTQHVYDSRVFSAPFQAQTPQTYHNNTATGPIGYNPFSSSPCSSTAVSPTPIPLQSYGLPYYHIHSMPTVSFTHSPIGSRSIPPDYGMPPISSALSNDGATFHTSRTTTPYASRPETPATPPTYYQPMHQQPREWDGLFGPQAQSYPTPYTPQAYPSPARTNSSSSIEGVPMVQFSRVERYRASIVPMIEDHIASASFGDQYRARSPTPRSVMASPEAWSSGRQRGDWQRRF